MKFLLLGFGCFLAGISSLTASDASVFPSKDSTSPNGEMVLYLKKQQDPLNPDFPFYPNELFFGKPGTPTPTTPVFHLPVKGLGMNGLPWFNTEDPPGLNVVWSPDNQRGFFQLHWKRSTTAFPFAITDGKVSVQPRLEYPPAQGDKEFPPDGYVMAKFEETAIKFTTPNEGSISITHGATLQDMEQNLPEEIEHTSLYTFKFEADGFCVVEPVAAK